MKLTQTALQPVVLYARPYRTFSLYFVDRLHSIKARFIYQDFYRRFYVFSSTHLDVTLAEYEGLLSCIRVMLYTWA